MRRTFPARRRLRIETLEKRQLLAADLSNVHELSHEPNAGTFTAGNDAAPLMGPIPSTVVNPRRAGVDGEVVIAIIDSGVDYRHPDLAAHMWRNPGEIEGNGVDDDANGYIDDLFGIDSGHGDSDPMDSYGHGTHVAGTALGIIGTYPESAPRADGVPAGLRIMALATGEYTPSADAVIEALHYMVKMKRDYGVNIVVGNHSYGVEPTPELAEAIKASIDAGILFVASAGNSGSDNDASPYYPASYDFDGVVSVAAVGRDDSFPAFSNFGASSVDLAAPGEGIVSTTLISSWEIEPDLYRSRSGTSMAAPQVAHAAGMFALANPGASPAEIEQALRAGAGPTASLESKTISGGQLDLDRTLAIDLAKLGPRVMTVSTEQDIPESEHPGRIHITFSEPIDAKGTVDIEHYRLWEAGPNRVLESGGGDDASVPFIVVRAGDRALDLRVEELTDGLYELVIDGLTDSAGNRLNATSIDHPGTASLHRFEIGQIATAPVTLPGITVTHADALSTRETAGSTRFSVVLDSIPTANVVIEVHSSNEHEGFVETKQLVFTPDNALVPQFVRVQSIDDQLADGDQDYSIILGAATSDDTNYQGLDVADVTITNIDDDLRLSSGLNTGPEDTGSIGSGQPHENLQPSLGVTYVIALQGIFPSRSAPRPTLSPQDNAFDSANPFLGQIAILGSNFAPRGWAFAAGQSLSIFDNQGLFAILGTTYGGDGVNNFRLPDLRGRIPVGAGSGPGAPQIDLGEVGGSDTVTLTESQLPGHQHALPEGASGPAGNNQPRNNYEPYLGLTYIIALNGIFPSLPIVGNRQFNAMDPFIGEIELFAGNFAPRGWAIADGRLLPISENSGLFALIGTTYGGDGSTTFALPDLRGRTAIGQGQGPGTSDVIRGQTFGVPENLLTPANLPTHSHAIFGGNTGTSGSGVPFENRMPSLGINFSVATSGTFPQFDDLDPFIGEIQMFAFGFAPLGYALANGQTLPIETNDTLFALLGTTYGGNGSTTFQLPDLRGRAARGFGNGTFQGEVMGSESVSLTLGQLPPHSHNDFTIVRQFPTTAVTDADTVTFRVSFHETAIPVDTTDFVLFGTAAAGATVASVTPTSVGVFDVLVTGIANSNGTLSLALSAAQDIQDAVGNVVTDVNPAISETYTLENQPLIVTSAFSTPDGFVVDFNQALDTVDLNLYDDRNGTLGPADLEIQGIVSGRLLGSLVIDDARTRIRFVSSAGMLVADTYTLRLFSGALAFESVTGRALDGDFDNIPGGDFTTTFVIDVTPPNVLLLSLPTFTRGRGQEVRYPNNASAGIPATLSSGRNVRSVNLIFTYNPALLSITGFTSSIPGASVSFTVTPVGSSAVANLSLTHTADFSLVDGEIKLGDFIASVPSTAPYASSHVLEVVNLVVRNASNATLQSRGLSGMHLAAFIGDSNKSQSYSSADVTLLQRLVVSTDTGLKNYPLSDPFLLADINQSGNLGSGDATLVQRLLVGTSIPFAPPIPVPITGPLNNEPAGPPLAGTSDTPIVSIGSTATVQENSASPWAETTDANRLSRDPEWKRRYTLVPRSMG